MSGLDSLEALIGAARRAGAEAADAVLVAGASVSVSRRLGKIEHLERTESQDIGLRVFIGGCGRAADRTADRARGGRGGGSVGGAGHHQFRWRRGGL